MLRVFPLCLMLVLCSCYNLGLLRREFRVRTEGSARFVAVEVWEPLPPYGDVSANSVVLGLLAYPLDVVVSGVQAVSAALDEDYAVRFGPVGAFGAILLPYLTLAPSLQAVPVSTPGAVVTDLEFRQLWYLASRKDQPGVVEVLRRLGAWDESLIPGERVDAGDLRIENLIRHGKDATRR